MSQTRFEKTEIAPTQRTAMVAAIAVALAMPFTANAGSTVYTLDADFDQGTLSGVNHTTPNNNQLQLNIVGTTFPVLWVANAGEDTLSKIDTNTGRQLARYRTFFGSGAFSNHGAFSGPAPSRSAVDINGNAYILNRHFDGGVPVLMKVLAEGFIDRNGNSVADTSIDTDGNGQISFSETKNLVDTNGNGIIDPNEIQDERIAWAKRIQLPSGTPSEVNGIGRALCIGTDGNLWVGMYNTGRYYKVSAADGSILSGPHSVNWNPYGCLVDGNGILWSASLGIVLGKLDTNNPATTQAFSDGSSNNYGIALGKDGKVYLASQNGWGFREFNPATNTFSTPGGSKGFSSFGISVDGSGNIWTGPYSPGGVRKYNAAGVQQCAGATQSSTETRGVIVDADNNIWQINRFSNSVSKYRGSDCAPLGVFPVGFDPYTYSDATGFAARNITTPTGTWTINKDGGANGTAWSKVSWTETVPTGAGVQVSVRADDNAANLPNLAFLPVTNGANPGVTGRFIQVQVRLNANTGGQSPILYDLTIATPDVNLVCDVDKDGDVDRNDITAIQNAIGSTPQPNDPRDANSDGKITVNDARACVLKCTRTNCAINQAD